MQAFFFYTNSLCQHFYFFPKAYVCCCCCFFTDMLYCLLLCFQTQFRMFKALLIYIFAFQKHISHKDKLLTAIIMWSSGLARCIVLCPQFLYSYVSLGRSSRQYLFMPLSKQTVVKTNVV